MGDANRIDRQIRRLPGQSLREEFQARLENRVLFPYFAMGMGLMLLWIEICHAWLGVPPNVWVGVAVFVVAAVVFAVSFYRNKAALRSIKLGEKGELIVAQTIERELLPKGYAVFHDIQICSGKKTFNIDHLLVGPNGVFAVETKNYSKPRKGGEVKVAYDGKRVLWNGKPHRKDEARQACASARAACEFISRETGLKVFVKPVLCAVGWYATSNDLYGNPVLLLMEKQLGTLIPKVYPAKRLSDQERGLIVEKLSAKNL